MSDVEVENRDVSSQKVDVRGNSWLIFIITLFIIAIGIGGYYFIKIKKSKKLS